MLFWRACFYQLPVSVCLCTYVYGQGTVFHILVICYTQSLILHIHYLSLSPFSFLSNDSIHVSRRLLLHCPYILSCTHIIVHELLYCLSLDWLKLFPVIISRLLSSLVSLLPSSPHILNLSPAFLPLPGQSYFMHSFCFFLNGIIYGTLCLIVSKMASKFPFSP